MKRQNYKATADTVGMLNRLPHDQLRFADFARLKSGRDIFSSRKLDELREMVSLEASETISREFDEDRDRAVCLRWHLRGLDVDKAIRKVKTDLEISRNAIEGSATNARVSDDDYNRELCDWESRVSRGYATYTDELFGRQTCRAEAATVAA